MDRRGWCRAAIAAFVELQELKAWEIEGLRPPVFVELASGERLVLALAWGIAEDQAYAAADVEGRAQFEGQSELPRWLDVQLFVGPDALEYYERIYLVEHGIWPMPYEWRSWAIGLSWQLADEMTSEQRLIATHAGQQGERWVAVEAEDARAIGRPVEDGDLELVTRCLRALLRVHGRGLLDKAAAKAGEGDDTLLLQISGDAMKPKVRASYVPRASWRLELSPIALPHDAAQWPRHEGTMEIGVFPLHVVGPRDERDLRIVALREKGRTEGGRFGVFARMDFGLAVERLFELLRTPQEEDALGLHGLWGRIEFCSPGLYGRLRAGLEELGVECELVEASESILEFGTSVSLALHGGGAEAPELRLPADDVGGWAQLASELFAHIRNAIRREDYDHESNWAEFYGAPLDPERLDALPQLSMLEMFVIHEWTYLRQPAPDEDVSLAEAELRDGLPYRLRPLIEGMRDSRVSVYLFKEKAGPVEFVAEDTATGEDVRFVDSGMPSIARPDSLLLMRRYVVDGNSFCTLLAPPLPAEALEELRRMLREDFGIDPTQLWPIDAEARLGRVCRRIEEMLFAEPR
jgi:hypothetical protein